MNLNYIYRMKTTPIDNDLLTFTITSVKSNKTYYFEASNTIIQYYEKCKDNNELDEFRKLNLFNTITMIQYLESGKVLLSTKDYHDNMIRITIGFDLSTNTINILLNLWLKERFQEEINPSSYYSIKFISNTNPSWIHVSLMKKILSIAKNCTLYFFNKIIYSEMNFSLISAGLSHTVSKEISSILIASFFNNYAENEIYLNYIDVSKFVQIQDTNISVEENKLGGKL